MNAPYPIRIQDPFEEAERLREEAWQAAREDCRDEYDVWVWNGIRGLRECDNNPREEVSFSDWLVDRAERRGGMYLAALTWVERRGL